MIECFPMRLSQDLSYAQAKIRENKRSWHKYDKYKYTVF